MGYTKWLIAALFATQAIAADLLAGERAGLRDAPTVPGKLAHSGRLMARNANPTAPLDRVASAVDGAESSHGSDMAMWRPDPSGPQGPMQVSEAAATDVGGGDRFDSLQNRAIGRAYLVQLYGRYRNWPDAIAAYNWGIGKMDAWVKAGRPPDKFLGGVAVYLRRVLHDSGLCDGAEAGRHRQSTEEMREAASAPPELACLRCMFRTRRLGRTIRFWRRTNSILQKTRPGAAAGPTARGARRVTGCYAANSKPAMCRAIFHIKSDSAMFDNIAVPSGSGSGNRVVAAYSIGLLPLKISRGRIPRSIRDANIVPCR